MQARSLAEVFGYPIDNMTQGALNHRDNRLCPYSNIVPACTKDKKDDPLGVCSISDERGMVIICPVRFREDWIIVKDASRFFFPESDPSDIRVLKEIRLADSQGSSAGNIDYVLALVDQAGKVADFGALEVQSVYISGNINNAFRYYMENPSEHCKPDAWKGKAYRFAPDYLSSSRKRLAPQLIMKGGILHSWLKKTAIAVDRSFFQTLPSLATVAPQEADIAWLVYDLKLDAERNRYKLASEEIVYSKFEDALQTITTREAGSLDSFVAKLQAKLKKAK